MKNVLGKSELGVIICVVLILSGLFYLLMGLLPLFFLMGFEWMLLMVIFFMFRPLKRKEVKAIKKQAVAFVKDHIIRLPDTDNSFNAIVDKGKPYLAIAKFKWAIGLFLILATAFYIFRSVDISFTHPVYGRTEVISFYVLSYLFAGIVFGFIILVMWLAARIPEICYKKADFYVMPKGTKGEEGKSIELAKNVVVKTAGVGLVTIVNGPKKYFATDSDLLILPEDKYIPPGQLERGKILYFGEESVLPYMEIEESEVKKDFKTEEPIVIQ